MAHRYRRWRNPATRCQLKQKPAHLLGSHSCLAATTGFIPRRERCALSGGFSLVTLKNVLVPLQFDEALLT
jgi:hypothetical protein